MTRIIQTAALVAGISLTAGHAAAQQFALNLGINSSSGRAVGVGVHVGQPAVVVPVAHPVPVPVAAPVPVCQKIWVPTTETVTRTVPIIGPCGTVIGHRTETEVINGGHWACGHAHPHAGCGLPVAPTAVVGGVAPGTIGHHHGVMPNPRRAPVVTNPGRGRNVAPVVTPRSVTRTGPQITRQPAGRPALDHRTARIVAQMR